MSPAVARPLLHAAHLLTFVLLLATGLLLWAPELRAAITGGYALRIRSAHLWTGAAFVVLPVSILWRAGVRAALRHATPPGARRRWQSLHLVLVLVLSALLTATGAALWAKRSLPDAYVTASLQLHDWLTYGAAALLVAHLAEVGAASLVSRLRAAAAGEGAGA